MTEYINLRNFFTTKILWTLESVDCDVDWTELWFTVWLRVHWTEAKFARKLLNSDDFSIFGGLGWLELHHFWAVHVCRRKLLPLGDCKKIRAHVWDTLGLCWEHICHILARDRRNLTRRGLGWNLTPRDPRGYKTENTVSATRHTWSSPIWAHFSRFSSEFSWP